VNGGRASLATLVREAFTVRTDRGRMPRIGAELELIPVRTTTGARVGIADDAGGPGVAAIVRRTARQHGWRERVDICGTPSWALPGGGTLAFEPGAQLEIASPVYDAPDLLGTFLTSTAGVLRDAANQDGVTLLATGVDPGGRVQDIPPQLGAERYVRMAAYFDRLGPAGIRMMRQTASLQVSVELGPQPLTRWRLLNSLAPVLVAVAANAAVYEGRDTGRASYRAHLWRTLDPSRTGLPYSEQDPVTTYVDFAARAGRILPDDAAHLTTLFPEVRPRGYFEVRSMDSVEPERAARIIRWLHRIVYDAEVARAALDVLGTPDPAALTRAGDAGLRDPALRGHAQALEALTGIVVT